MQFDSWEAFVAMGGYGQYVWLAFGVTLVAMVWLVVEARWQHRKLISEVKQQEARKARIRAARDERPQQSDNSELAGTQ